MRRSISLLICLALVLSTAWAYAAPVGNIATPAVLKKGLIIKDEQGQYGIIAESENDITFDRNLKDQASDTQFMFFGGKLGVLFLDRFIAYGVLGGGQAQQTFQFGDLNIKWSSDYDIVWAVGGTAMVYEKQFKELWNGIMRLGFDGRYRQAHLDVDDPNQAPKYEFDEWQVAFEVTYEIDNFIPYVGVKYSDATGDATATVNGNSYKIDFENNDKIGIFVGGDYVFQDVASINLEGRFIDETALTAGLTVRF
ncbi:MAG: hypothetical protein HQ558_02330 [Candidatus Omnitrophica bacterium]|nr:hypothetical protein [Candidatus Omnitrophota bacterium]